MANYNNANFLDLSVFNALIPKGGPQCIPFALNFATQTEYDIDLTIQQQNGKMDIIQSMFVDNSLNASPVTITIGGSRQIIVCPAQAQGVFPCFVPNPPRFIVTTAGGVQVNLFTLNIPMSAFVWETVLSGSGPTANVADAILDATVSNNRVNTSNHVTGSGGTTYPQLVGNVVATGSTAVTTGILVTGAPGYYITGIAMQLAPGSTIAAGTELDVTITDSTTGAVFSGTFAVPSAGIQTLQSQPGYLWNNKVGGSTLTVALSTPLTSGKLIYNISYAIAAFVN